MNKGRTMKWLLKASGKRKMEDGYEWIRPTTLNPDPSSHCQVRKPDREGVMQQETHGTPITPGASAPNCRMQETKVREHVTQPHRNATAKSLARRPCFFSKHRKGGGRRRKKETQENSS